MTFRMNNTWVTLRRGRIVAQGETALRTKAAAKLYSLPVETLEKLKARVLAEVERTKKEVQK